MSFIKQIEQDIIVAQAARKAGHRLVFGYLGMPGIGKTQAIHSVAESLGYEVWAGFNIATASPMDVAIKMPNMERGTFTTLPNDDFPWEHEVGDRKIVLFIDELTNGTTDTVKAIQRLINEGCLGKFKLGKNVITLLAGNRQTDKAGSNSLTTAMYNRVVWRNISWGVEESDAALDHILKKHLPEESQKAKELLAVTQGYFKFKPILEGDFIAARDKLGKEPFIQWCSPRSLEALITRISCTNWTLPGVFDMAGDIGLGRASELHGFFSLIGEMDSFEKIVKDPDTARIPDSVEKKYAMISMLSARVRKLDFGAVWEYIRRIEEKTIQIAFIQLAVKSSPDVRGTKEFNEICKNEKQLISIIAAA